MLELTLDIVNNLPNSLFSVSDFLTLDLAFFDLDWQTLAQTGQHFNQDVTRDIAGGWNNFVRSGQVWALLIGLTLGYLFKSITSF